jgi:hypothetical protein
MSESIIYVMKVIELLQYVLLVWTNIHVSERWIPTTDIPSGKYVISITDKVDMHTEL